MLDDFLKYIDFIIPSALKIDNKVLNKTRLFIGILIVSLILAILVDFAGLYETSEDLVSVTIVLTYLYSAISFSVLWLFKKLPIAVNCLIFLLAVNLNIAIMQTGGVYSSTLDWLSFIPLIALLIIGFKSTIFWILIIALNIIGIYFYSENGFPNTAMKEDYFVNSFFFLLALFLLIILFWRSQMGLIKDLETHQSAIEAKQQALERKNKQLKKKTNELNAAQIALANSNGVLGIQNDRLQEIQEELMYSNKALERYAHTVSHDLKEPLRSIYSFAKVLYNRYDQKQMIDKESKECFDFILNGTDNMNKLISEMLKYSESGSNTEGFKLININQTLQIVKQNLSNQIQESGAKINVPLLPKIEALPIPITQLFQNLISNAIKYRKEAVVPQIDIHFIENEKEWQFSITDNGIGIKKGNCSKIFNEFGRLHDQQEIEGQGIGLTTCKDIVRKHKGKIWLESEFGTGTTFYFTLSKKVKQFEDTPKKTKEKESVDE